MKSVNGEHDAWTSQTVLKAAVKHADKHTYETCLLIHNFVLYTSFGFLLVVQCASSQTLGLEACCLT